MSRVIRAALFQTAWTGDKESMIQVHEQAARDAAAQGAQVLCFQELFYGPYFCQVQDKAFYEYAERIPDGPTVRRFQALARELGIVLVLPMYEEEQPGVLYNTAAVIDADGSYLGKYRKTHIPQVQGFWEKFYFRPGNSGWPVFDTAVGRIGVYICYDRHFPEGWRALGLAGAEIVFNPSATSRGLSRYLWQLEQPAAAVANEYFVGAIQPGRRGGPGRQRLLRHDVLRGPGGQFVGEPASDKETELVVRDLDMARLREVRDRWQFYRDRAPGAYGPLTAP
ncbi:apolipoprotein acyltransferase [Streptomyces echinatus]|uniref:nitrilase-related carbon-nitrogen hydrolase n=1 Tax=Streptomyces echinatus TaxID=67293 RepID=UPI0031EDE8DD